MKLLALDETRTTGADLRHLKSLTALTDLTLDYTAVQRAGLIYSPI